METGFFGELVLRPVQFLSELANAQAKSFKLVFIFRRQRKESRLYEDDESIDDEYQFNKSPRSIKSRGGSVQSICNGFPFRAFGQSFHNDMQRAGFIGTM